MLCEDKGKSRKARLHLHLFQGFLRPFSRGHIRRKSRLQTLRKVFERCHVGLPSTLTSEALVVLVGRLYEILRFPFLLSFGSL